MYIVQALKEHWVFFEYSISAIWALCESTLRVLVEFSLSARQMLLECLKCIFWFTPESMTPRETKIKQTFLLNAFF